MPRKLVLFFITLWLSACANTPAIPEAAPAEEIFALAAPLGPARRIEQKITAVWPGRKERLLCILELDRQHIAVAGLNQNGLALFSLNFDGKKTVVDKSPLLPAGFAPEFIVRDIQLAYWPQAELEKHLPRQWRLITGSTRRLVYRDKVLLFDINYSEPDSAWPSLVVLNNRSQHYRLEIETLSHEIIPE